jgi:hypothetical protein
MGRQFNKWVVSAARQKAKEYLNAAIVGLESRQVGEITVYGGEAFRDEVTAALNYLSSRDHFHYRKVQRFLRAIVESARIVALLVRNAVVGRQIRALDSAAQLERTLWL